MDQNMQMSAEQQLKKQRRKKIWKRIVAVLGSVVIFCTTYALILPAITLSDTAYCGIEEHKHEDACYTQNLICTEEISGTEEHFHKEGCYQKQLICQLKEHKHTDSCFSNPEADVETVAEWEETLPEELTGKWREDVLLVAESQLGYKESKNNYMVDEDGEKNGYTRYGDWYGDDYGHWCAMFVSFCMDYAGVEGIPIDANCQNWIGALKECGLYREASSYIPQKGDIIFFEQDLDGISHHVGIVSKVTLNDDGSVREVRTIEGNAENDVCEYNTYKASNPKIVGYGELAQTGLKKEATAVTYEDDTMKVTAIFPGEFKVSENAELVVQQIDSKLEKETFDEMSQSVSDELIEDENMILGNLNVYDISLQDDGEEVEVPKNVKVKINVRYKEPLYTEEEMETAAQISVLTLEKGTVNAQGYAVTEPEATVLDVEDGVTGFSLENEGLEPFGVTTVTETRTGNFWVRVEDFSEIKNGDTLLIVSVEGNTALTYGDNTQGIPVTLKQVKGYSLHYDITDEDEVNSLADNNAFMDSKFIVSNIGNSRLRLQSQGTTRRYLTLSNGTTVFANTGAYLTLAKQSPENAWKISNGNYYLSYERDEELVSSNNSANARRDMYIFRLVNETLQIPVDCTNVSNPKPLPEAPTYATDIVPTDELTGTTTIVDVPGLTVDYASDQSTSDIEVQFTDSEADDGKVLTDKSVIYRKDDYGAFTDYEDGVFGITLSALGQVTSEKSEVNPVMDVVIILDTSYSMINNASHYLDANGDIRMTWAMKAVNEVIDQIMAEPTNRVGLVTFSDTSQVVLPLDHYTTTGGQYLDLVADNTKNDANADVNHGRGTNFYDLNINRNVKNSSNVTPSFDFKYGPGEPNWEGTYTQSGIAEAANILLGNSDTSDKYGNPRQPVIILISDGGPTLSSSNYKEPLDGPIYGNSGQTAEGDHDADHSANSNNGTGVNRYGINGFYTVLTAQYFKNLVGSHYGLQTKFASVGIGIDNTQDSNTDSRLHDNRYCRAVLNPTQENLRDALNTFDGFTGEGRQFVDLLNNNFDQQYVSIPNHSDGYTTIGTTYSAMPVISNPYTSYDYADQYYTGKSSSLASDLISYLKSIQRREHTWRTIIENNTHVEIVDPIGEGMEVKGEPVLNFGRKNYKATSKRTEGNVTTYVYDYKMDYSEAYPSNADSDNKPANTLLDLSRILVTVTTECEGDDALQTVKLDIPEDLLPIFYPEKYGAFFYEEDPVRLIFQVGLTEAAKEESRNIKAGETKVYYTNRWDSSGNPTTEAHFTKYTGTDNPNLYPFEIMPDVAKQGAEKPNPTETIRTSFECEANGSDVTQKLGNNGRLVIGRETTSVSVTKKWSDDIDHDPITIHLLADGVVVEGRSIQLPYNGKWEYTWESLAKTNSDGSEIRYSVAEDYVPGYSVEYEFLEEGSKITTEGWAPTTTLVNGTAYMLVSNQTGKVLAANGTDKFVWKDLPDVTTSLEDMEDKTLIWERRTNNRFYNVGTQNTMGYNSDENFTSNGNDEVSYSTSNFKLSFRVWQIWRYVTYYFEDINSQGYGDGTTTSDSGHQFTLYSWQTTSVDVTKDTWVITNTKSEDPLEILIRKTDNYQNALNGAVFDLYKEDATGDAVPGTDGTVRGTIIQHNVAVDNKGEVAVALPREDGVYYLIETVAPEGYTLLVKPIKITVSDEKISIDGHEFAELNGTTLTVVNKAAYELPMTGGSGTTLYILGGMMIMLSAFLIFIKKNF